MHETHRCWTLVRGLVPCLAVAFGHGCGDSHGGTAAEAGPLAARIELSQVAPGEEETVCIDVQLNNPDIVWLRGIRTHINQGSHHMIVYRTSQQEESLEPRPCFPFVGDLTSVDVSAPLFIAQQSEAGLDYPNGSALALEPNQMIRLEFHYINYFTDPVDITGEVEFLPYEGDLDEVAPVNMIFWGTLDIDIDPNSTGEAGFYHQVEGTNGVYPEPIQIFGLTSHTHQRGTRATIERTTAWEATEAELLHESLDWAEPPLDLFDPPLVFDGTDGLRLICEYENDTNVHVGFGEGFDDEMCFLWAYYFPSRGFLIDF